MKSVALFVGAIICLLITVAPAFAQDYTIVRATVPFEFWMGDQKFPAGDYVFKTSDYDLNSTNHKIQIDRITDSGIETKYIMSNDKKLAAVAKDKKLVFYRDGNKYTLHQIVSGGDGHVHDVSHQIEVIDVK